MIIKNKPIGFLRSLLFVASVASLATPSYAAVLTPSDPAANDYFGKEVSISGNIGLIGASYDDDKGADSGSAYLFRNLNTASGTVIQTAKLLASDGAASNYFGDSVSVDGNNGLVGAHARGAAYLYRGLDTASGTTTQTAKLLQSSSESGSSFGVSVSLSGNNGVIGAHSGGANIAGRAYVFRGLDTATGTVNEKATLISSDGASADYFAQVVSLSGNIALIGAYGDDDKGDLSGSAYVFRNLDTVTGTVTQNAKLLASDGAASDAFARNLHMNGTIGLVGVVGKAAYLYRNLDTVTGNVTENAKLIASDGISGFACSMSVSGNTGMVGSASKRAAYVFFNLNTASGTVKADLKITPSAAGTGDNFGGSVRLDGNSFVVGAYQGTVNGKKSGYAYSGDLRTFTTLNAGSTSLATDGLSATLLDNWIIGTTKSNNTVTINAGDSVTATASNKYVYIGTNSTGSNNKLVVEGSLTATVIYVGGPLSSDNALEFKSTATTQIGAIMVDNGNKVYMPAGSTINDLLTKATSINIKDKNNQWVQVTSAFGYDPITGIISLPVPVISGFTGANPIAPTANISVSPQSGPAPLNSTVTWSSTNAGSVSVSGPNLSSTSTSGNKAFTNLTQGSYTYTITVNPTSATLSWTTTGADSLTLITPGGNVDVTGKTSHPVSVSGSYTLQATNTNGTKTSQAVIVTIPAAATDSKTITVAIAKPVIDTLTPTIPTAPTVNISASPQSGPAPLNSTVSWGSSNAGSVSVSGPSFITSSAVTGSQGLNALAQGSHKYTITATPKSTTLNWTTSGGAITSIVMTTPSGDVSITPVTKTSYTVTASGDYTLKVTNASGTVSKTVTVAIPAAATAETTIVVGVALPVINTFTPANPTAPTVNISASPQSGPAPLNSTVSWGSTNAATVSVNGPSLTSSAVSGSQALSALAQGSYTYTIAATPNGATLNWTTSGGAINSLVLTTPSGDVTITPVTRTSYTVNASGDYTLKATNASGTVSQTVTVAIPATATAETTIVVGVALPVINTFTPANPMAPTANISATPQSGAAPLNSTVSWGSGNAKTVSVTGPSLTSTSASGSKSLNALAKGEYTYTITATPNTGLLTWTTIGTIDSLMLTTPSGDVNVSGLTSYQPTVTGDYTLKATNPSGTATSPTKRIEIPNAAIATTTIVVGDVLPTKPATIDPDTIVVTPGTGGGLTVTGEIDPTVDGAEKTLDLSKLMVYTTTDLKTASAWLAATQGTHYSVTLNAEKTAFTLTINPLSGSDTVRFYRVATSTKAFNANGTPAADSVTKYNTTISGQYKMTIPARKMMLVANQLVTTDNTVGTLFANLPGRSIVDVVDMEPASETYGGMLTSTRRNSGAGWSLGGDFVLPVGYAALVTNGSSTTAATLTFSGLVPQTVQTYLLPSGVTYLLGSAVPVAVNSPADIGYVMKRRDFFDKMDLDGVTETYTVNNAGTAWSGGNVPSFGIGEGYLYQPYADAGWEQAALIVSDDTLIVR